MSQRMEALERANRIRLDRAAHKREIAALDRMSGREQVALILESPADCWLRASLEEVLKVPQYSGPTVAAKMCRLASTAAWPINPRQRVGELTDRRRLSLCEVLRRRGR